MSQDQMREFIRESIREPKMNEYAIKYVQSSPECQKNKVARDKTYGLLQMLEPAYTPSQSIDMDFITDLPLS
jgi:hypothetical protein